MLWLRFLREEEEDEQLNKLMKDFSEYLHRLRGSRDPSHQNRSLVTTNPHRCSRVGNYPIEDFPSSAALIELDRILPVVCVCVCYFKANVFISFDLMTPNGKSVKQNAPPLVVDRVPIR